MPPIRMIVLGAGARGMNAYAPYAEEYPQKLQIAAAAEPVAARREAFAARYGLDGKHVFSDWREALAARVEAQAVLVSMQDRQHVEPACRAMAAGYDVLIEKPVALTPEDFAKVTAASRRTGRRAAVCHVLRYAPFFVALKRLIDEGTVGQIVDVVHNENIGWWHMAHSYVRGNWRREEETSPIILAKSCHDMDILCYLIGARCTTVASFGSLEHFKAENAPEGSAGRCLDCKYKDVCAYSAATIYLDMTKTKGYIRVACPDGVDYDARVKALREGPYGRCVYRCDNDVCDHQSSILAFENGVTACFNMSGFTAYDSGRTLRIMGTRGEIRAHMGADLIEVMDFCTRQKRIVDITGAVRNEYAHGGGDFALTEAFVAYAAGRAPVTCGIEDAAQSHLMCYAAEEARRSGTVVDVGEYTRRYEKAVEKEEALFICEGGQ